MNQVWLNGRLTADPDGGEGGNGIAYAKFSVAIEKGSGENKQTDYIDCVAFRQTAEFVRKYFTKGDAINVVGSISVRDWEDQQSGVKRRKYEIVVTQVGFPVSSRSKNAGGSGGGSTGARQGGAPRNGRSHAGAGAGSGYNDRQWGEEY